MPHNCARLVLPNTEVEDSLLRLYLAENHLKPKNNLKLEINALDNYIDSKDIKIIIKIFNDILNDCVSILDKIFQDERSVRDLIYAALTKDINLQKFKERERVNEYSDLELVTRKTHMVIEFKRATPDRDAKASLQAALCQLQEKNYGVGAFQDHMLYRVAMVIHTEEKKILIDSYNELI